MKIEWNKKYTTISAYSIIVVFLSMIFYIIISEFGVFMAGLNRYIKVFAPFTIGFAIAYLANFIMDFIERKAISPLLSHRKGNKVKRIVSLLLTYLLLIAGLFLFIYLVLPQLINSVTGAVYMVINNYDSLSKSIIDFISKLNISQSFIDDIVLRWNDFVDNIINIISNSLPLIGSYAGRLFSSIWNIILGIIISVYMLIDKERFSLLLKKLNFSIFSKERAKRNIELTKRADNIFWKILSWEDNRFDNNCDFNLYYFNYHKNAIFIINRFYNWSNKYDSFFWTFHWSDTFIFYHTICFPN